MSDEFQIYRNNVLAICETVVGLDNSTATLNHIADGLDEGAVITGSTAASLIKAAVALIEKQKPILFKMQRHNLSKIPDQSCGIPCELCTFENSAVCQGPTVSP
jgi:uncharacterized phage infection (PIP) family protein YhgE